MSLIVGFGRLAYMEPEQKDNQPRFASEALKPLPKFCPLKPVGVQSSAPVD